MSHALLALLYWEPKNDSSESLGLVSDHVHTIYVSTHPGLQLSIAMIAEGCHCSICSSMRMSLIFMT